MAFPSPPKASTPLSDRHVDRPKPDPSPIDAAPQTLFSPETQSIGASTCTGHKVTHSVLAVIYAAPSNKAALLASMKQALSISIAGLLTFVPALERRTPQSYWGALAICFILTDESKGLGASVAIGETRLLGTTLGSIYALLILSLPGFGESYLFELPVLLGIWASATALFRGHPRRGYAFVVAAFTAAIIMHGGIALDESGGDEDGDGDDVLTRETLALHRITMNFVGISLYVSIDVLLAPKSVRRIIRHSQAPLLKGVARGVAEAMFLFAFKNETGCLPEDDLRLIGDKKDTLKASVTSKEDCLALVEGGISIDIKDTMEAVEALQGLLVSADDEPTLWRKPFPRAAYGRALAAEKACLGLIILLREATFDANDSAVLLSLPASVAPSMVAFTEHVRDAAAASSGVWEMIQSGEADAAILETGIEGPMSPSAANLVEPWSSLGPAVTKSESLFGIVSAAQIATPLIALKPYTEKGLLDQRNSLVLHAYTANTPLPQKTVLGWMATCFLCQEISAALGELGESLREIRALESELAF